MDSSTDSIYPIDSHRILPLVFIELLYAIEP